VLAGVLAGVDAGGLAGVDAGVLAGVDAGVDAGVLAGVDAGVLAGVDAGVLAGVDAGVLAGVLAGVDEPWYVDALAEVDVDWEADRPGPLCPPDVDADSEEVTAAGDWTGVGVFPVNEVTAKAVAPDITRSAPMTHASTSGRHPRRRGRLRPPIGG
jgi:hypothetical protein